MGWAFSIEVLHRQIDARVRRWRSATRWYIASFERPSCDSGLPELAVLVVLERKQPTRRCDNVTVAWVGRATLGQAATESWSRGWCCSARGKLRL